MEEILNNLVTYGYLFLFVLSFGGGMFGLICAGIFASSGKMDISLCIIVAAIANFLGDCVLICLSRYSKKDVMPYIKKHRRKIALAQVLIKKYGSKIILIKKYIYGVKTIIPLAIGLTKYSFLKFSILNAISSIIWATSVGLTAYFAGEKIMQFWENYGENWFYFIAGFIILLIFIYFVLFSKKKEKNL